MGTIRELIIRSIISYIWKSFKVCRPVKVAKIGRGILVKMTPADFGDVDAIWKIAKTITLPLRLFLHYRAGGDLQFTKLRKLYMCYRTGHKELMPLLMYPAPRGKKGS